MAGKRIYVKVEAAFTPEGKVLPVWLEWEDGRRFAIDKILDVRPGHSLKAGGNGIRYTVEIWGEPRYLFYEDENNRWFLPDHRARQT